jgi:hypothetical protein
LGLGGTSAKDVAQVPGVRNMVDADTPSDAMTRASWTDPSKTLKLIWSDEFNTDGRSFYPGDDPFWEAQNLNYWQTGDEEWYGVCSTTVSARCLLLIASARAQIPVRSRRTADTSRSR